MNCTMRITVASVLSGERPVLYVSHDIDDGGWQFLSGEPADRDQAKLVCLEDAVALDPRLLELSDLKLGWSAERATPSAAWVRSAAYATDWEELVEQAYAYASACQERMEEEFSLSSWARYHYDQERAQIEFADGDRPGLTADIRIIGSTSNLSNTWLWSWDNPSILDGSKEAVHLLQRFGTQHGFERLREAKWPADEIDAWEMTSIACLLFQGAGVYRAPDDHGTTYLVLLNPTLG